MTSTSYNFIAVGVVFTALNVYVGDVQLLLPTCFGYALIAGGCWRLRFGGAVYRWAAFVAGVLAVMSLPDLFTYSWSHPEYPGALWGYYNASHYPRIVMMTAVFVGIAVAIACEARRQGWGVLAVTAGAAGGWHLGMAGYWVLHGPGSRTELIVTELLALAGNVLLACVCVSAGRRLV